MPKGRSDKQATANWIDCELARLARQAERTDMKDVQLAIDRARVVIRSKMHRDDRAITS